MSDFVDKYTVEAEANKKKIVSEYEQKLASEKAASDELK